MRMAFGLVGLLVTIAIIAVLWSKSAKTSVDTYEKVQPIVSQIAGRDANGNNIETTYADFPDLRSDGKLQDLQITQLAPDSPLAQYFGLQKNDVVIAGIDGHGVRTDLNGLDDERAGKDAIWDAYTQSGQLIVQRGDKTLTLPAPKNAANPNPMAAAQNQNARRTEQQQEGKSNNGSEGGTMDEIRQRLHPVSSY